MTSSPSPDSTDKLTALVAAFILALLGLTGFDPILGMVLSVVFFAVLSLLVWKIVRAEREKDAIQPEEES